VWTLAVGILPAEVAVLHNDLPVIDVIAEPKAAQRKSPLAIAFAHTFQLLDMVGMTAVIRVGRENLVGTTLDGLKFPMRPDESLCKPLVAGRGVNRKRWRYAF